MPAGRQEYAVWNLHAQIRVSWYFNKCGHENYGRGDCNYEINKIPGDGLLKREWAADIGGYFESQNGFSD